MSYTGSHIKFIYYCLLITSIFACRMLCSLNGTDYAWKKIGLGYLVVMTIVHLYWCWSTILFWPLFCHFWVLSSTLRPVINGLITHWTLFQHFISQSWQSTQIYFYEYWKGCLFLVANNTVGITDIVTFNYCNEFPTKVYTDFLREMICVLTFHL